jgi:hypothetical protein
MKSASFTEEEINYIENGLKPDIRVNGEGVRFNGTAPDTECAFCFEI